MPNPTVPAAATGLPSNILPFSKNDGRDFLPLDPDLVEMLSEPSWSQIGLSCRMALVGFRVSDDELPLVLGELIDDDPGIPAEVVERRTVHRKALLRIALAARGF